MTTAVIDLARLKASRAHVAVLVEKNIFFAPVFAVLDAECAAAEAYLAADPVERARHLLKAKIAAA